MSFHGKATTAQTKHMFAAFASLDVSPSVVRSSIGTQEALDLDTTLRYERLENVRDIVP
jgi:hypothetical protein